ncbi:MAG: diaminopimelate decarboxylase [Betaproteobacteria bacterium 13_1_20CM_3_63_8]|nr:MAG: diaminopimelate decarboxylase [Betaproteobacteria bacterium 13_1_20CM_3_63_8]
MKAFDYRGGVLAAEGVSLADIAGRYGTPCFVYSRAALEGAFREFDAAFGDAPHLVCYAVKANPNLALLNLLARLGSGFDIVSGGELARVIAAGGDPGKIVFSGVGKTIAEMHRGLELGIHCFNVESTSELDHLDAVAGQAGKRAPVSIRVNPDVDPGTHPYILTGLKENKFGVALDDALPLYRRAAGLANVEVRGIDMHIGSQIEGLDPHLEAAAKMLALVDRLSAEGIRLEHIDFGGGIGIRYRDEETVDPNQYALAIRRLLGSRPLKLLFEPGRFLVGNAGVLLTRVSYLKPGPLRNFAIVDAAMNDLLRPALYDAWHDVRPVVPRTLAEQLWQVVGPVCESADFLARDRMLALVEGDLLAILSAGAYAMAMSSNYNSRARAAEVIVDGEKVHLVRPRETIEELFAHESLMP